MLGGAGGIGAIGSQYVEVGGQVFEGIEAGGGAAFAVAPAHEVLGSGVGVGAVDA